jgi:hypothetical protein
MQLHKRTMMVQGAQNEFNSFVIDLIEKHELTYGEIIGIIADRLASFGKLMRREERYPGDPDARGDLA